MIYYSGLLRQKFNNYSNINNKISREVKKNNYIKVVKGLYVDDERTPGYLLAGAIYGPSYLSFDYALFYYGMIPERVVNYTSATYSKKKIKEYHTSFGTYYYRDVPKEVYFKEIILVEENGYYYQIASKEKAICDKLYSLSPVHNMKKLKNLLFNDLRINEDDIYSLNQNIIEELSKYYHSTNINLLVKLLKGGYNE